MQDDDSELLLERVEEEMAADALSDDEADDTLLRVDDLRGSNRVCWCLCTGQWTNRGIGAMRIVDICW